MNSAGDDLVFFERLGEEASEEAAAVQQGVLGGLFSRFFGSSSSTPLPSTSSAGTATPNGDITTATESTADAPLTGDMPPFAPTIEAPKKFSGRIASIFRGADGPAQKPLSAEERINNRQYWMPDSMGKACFQCEEKFTAFRRRHHCRICGQIFCSKCCNMHIPKPSLGYMGELRLCGYCASMYAHCVQDAEVEGESSPQFAPSSPTLNDVPSSDVENGISTVSGRNGSLVWTRNEDPIVSSDSVVALPTTKATPSLLCVQDLYLTHNGTSLRVEERTPSEHSQDESEPAWVRDIDMTGEKDFDSFASNESTSVTSHELMVEVEEKKMEVEDEKESPSRKSQKSEDRDREIESGDLAAAFEQQALQMLDYLLDRERLSHEEWKPKLWQVGQAVARTVKVDVCKKKDEMNVLNYVHIKKLHVPEETRSAEIVWGVVCSKTVAHAEMGGELENASVMIVAGSIEYERVAGKLSSLEPILSQEKEFLRKQVDRILTRRPSLLLVERGVSRVACQMLREEGVRVVVNVSPRVLRRVARATNADVLPACDAQLLQDSVGFCPLFAQRQFPLKDGSTKTLLFFDDCPPERGCSVLLRGPSARELRAAKRVLNFMVSLLYSSDLERAFLSLHSTTVAGVPNGCEVCEARREAIDRDATKEEGGFEESLEKSILSASPVIEFEPPFLETAKGRDCPLLPYFKQPLYHFLSREDLKSRAELEEAQDEEFLKRGRTKLPEMPRHPFAVDKKITKLDQGVIASFRALGGLAFHKRFMNRPQPVPKPKNEKAAEQDRDDVLSPFLHQRVAILFGSFSPKSPNAPFFCIRPWVVCMEFYGTHDMPLGDFLTRYCFNKEYQCPSTNCDVGMLEHSRKMVFGRVCIEVSTQMVVQSSDLSPSTPPLQGAPSASTNNQILSWHYCPTCKMSSPLVGLNTAVWHLSFAKFLDYLANGRYSRSVLNCTHSSSSPCTHCAFHQHSHFFSYNNYVTTFKITPIRPFHVQFSPVKCVIRHGSVTRKALVDGVTRMAALGEDLAKSADAQLAKFRQHPDFSTHGNFHTQLAALCHSVKTNIAEKLAQAASLREEGPAVLTANDPLAIKANDLLMEIRESVFTLVSTWNEQSSVLGATVRALKNPSASSASLSAQLITSQESVTPTPEEVPEISLDRLEDPFPSSLHLALKLQPRVGVVVRDIQDSRGHFKPDIGSVIGYALSSVDYEESRRRAREWKGMEDVPLNLNANSVGSENFAAAEHLEVEFQDSQASYYVKVYYAERFRLLRKLLFEEGEEAFIRSLSQATFWTPQGGKSGAHFYRTQDDRFIFKQMSRFEIQSFVKFAPNYFEYIKTAVTEHKLTTLCKVYGVFRIGYKSKTAQVKMDLLVMEYLFYKRNIACVWDLKGSQRNRWASERGKSSSDDLVLLDENLMKDLWNKQLYVFPHSKAALNQAISNDSHFLSAQSVMDYSLLVGVDETRGELVLGIVDYMRTYTLDKKLESWVKIVAIPGSHLPTIISPEMYCTRFSEAIDSYFPVVPDQWTGLGSAMSY